MNPGKTAVIVVSHRAAPSLKACLESVFRHTEDSRFQVLVMDNAAGEETRQVVRAFEAGQRRLRVVHLRKNLGKAEAVNRAVGLIKAPWYAVLDDDAIVGRGWLAGLQEAARSDRRRPSVIGCRSVYPNGRLYSAELPARIDNLWGQERDLGQRSYVRDCDVLCGVCLLVRADVFREIRFDASLGQQFEDADFCWQARKAGRRLLYCGVVRVTHTHEYRSSSPHARRNHRTVFSRWGFPTFPDSHPLDKVYTEAWRLHQAGEWEALLGAYRRMERLDPVPAYAQWGRAFALNRLRRRREALACAGRALAEPCLSDHFRARLKLLIHSLKAAADA